MSKSKIDYLPPKPGCKIRVIGAGTPSLLFPTLNPSNHIPGLPRTGTNSFCAALSHLLKGPTYHAGVQYGSLGCPSEKHILTMIQACNLPTLPPPQKETALQNLSSILQGYVATADPPLSLLIPELLTLYPEALVLCTVRDPQTWTRSILEISRAARPTLAGFIFFWIPSVRYLPTLVKNMSNLFEIRYGTGIKDETSAMQVWERHHAWLEEIVPKNRLFYVDVKEGWEPICKALGREVPDVPFPRLNEIGEAEEHFRKMAIKGLGRWGMVFGAVAGVLGVGYWYWRG